MKKLSIIAFIALISTNYIMQAELINGFSDIRAKNPRKRSERLQASDNRIEEQMGNPVSTESFMSFLELTQKYIGNLKKRPDTEKLKVAVCAVVDLFRSYPQIDEQSDEIQEALDQLKNRVSKFKLGKLQNLLNDMARNQ